MKHLSLAVVSVLILSASIAISPVAASSIQSDAAAFDVPTGAGNFATSPPEPADVSFTIPGALSSGAAHGFAESGFGVLSALASASASTVIADPAEYGNDPHQVFARGFGSAQFTDTITLHSSQDLSVDVMIGAAVHGDVVSSGYNLSYWCLPGNIDRFANTEPFVNLFVTGFPSGGETLGHGACPRATDRSSFSTQLTLPVEVPITFNVQLVTAAEASPYFGQSPLDFSNNLMSVSTSADASNTGFFFFQVLTLGATYTSESGTVYLTGPPVAAVSEPASLSLVGAGLTAVVALSRRRGRRSSCLGTKR